MKSTLLGSVYCLDLGLVIESPSGPLGLPPKAPGEK